MTYSKVVLNEAEARELYREDLVLRDDGRILFRKMRYFREYLGVHLCGEDLCRCGTPIKAALELPGYIPVRNPTENWFQVAMREPIGSIDPLRIEARCKGFLPAYFVYDPYEKIGTIRVEDDPEFDFVDYALFIYDRADYESFTEAVRRFIENRLRTAPNRETAVVRDMVGNTIMISDSLTDQAILLMPLALLDGGAREAKEAWKRVLNITSTFERG